MNVYIQAILDFLLKLLSIVLGCFQDAFLHWSLGIGGILMSLSVTVSLVEGEPSSVSWAFFCRGRGGAFLQEVLHVKWQCVQVFIQCQQTQSL